MGFIDNILTNGSDDEINALIDNVFNGDREKFLNYLDVKGLLNGENLYAFLEEEIPMSYLSYMFNNNPEKTTKYIVDNYFGDITEVNGRYILKLGNREDLSVFFKSDGGRHDMSSKELAEKILGEDWWEPFYDVSQDIYDEVVEVLTPENLKLLAEKINDELSGSKIEPETSLLEDIAIDQGHPDYVELSVDLLLNTIFEDKESTEYIIEREATETSSELYSLYHNAYNSAYVDEKWEQVSDEIKSILSIDNMGEWQTKTVKGYDGKERKINNYFIDVTNFLPEVIQSVFDDKYMMDDYRNQFEYYSDFENLIAEMIYEDVIEGGSISIAYYDYPDHTRVERNINDLFPDYI